MSSIKKQSYFGHSCWCVKSSLTNNFQVLESMNDFLRKACINSNAFYIGYSCWLPLFRCEYINKNIANIVVYTLLWNGIY